MPQIFNGLATRFDSTICTVCPELDAGSAPAGENRVKIAMAVVTNETRQFGDPLQVKNIALEVLKKARNNMDHNYANFKDFPV